MNIKSEINQLQKQLLVRLNVKKGSTLFTIIEAITRQAYVKESFVVSQKNSTLAEKCKVTASTISRNLKKLKDKCADLISIDQNRNVEEKFAALVFTFRLEGVVVLTETEECQTEVSNGYQTEPVNNSNEAIETAEITSRIFSTNPLVSDNKTNKDLNTYIVNKEMTTNEKNQIDESINKLTTEYRLKGMSKTLAMRVVREVMQNIHNIKNFGGYLRNCLENAWYKAQVKLGYIDPAEKLRNAIQNSGAFWYDWLSE